MTTLPDEASLHPGLRELLPPRAAALDQLAGLLPGSAARPMALLVVGRWCRWPPRAPWAPVG